MGWGALNQKYRNVSDSVVASLWNVNDECTSLFMPDFRRGLREGLMKAEALRTVRRELMQMRIKSDIYG
jgi:CHAT domain-containing protein